MLPQRKNARDTLLKASLSKYRDLIKEAKLSPRQQNIADEKFIEGKANHQIANDLGYCLEVIRNELMEIYDSISRLIIKY